MSTKVISIRVYDLTHKRLRGLRPYIAAKADEPRDVGDTTLSDVARRALALGVELLEQERDRDIMRGRYEEPKDYTPSPSHKASGRE